MSSKKNVILLTDFSYQAKGRLYFREDVELSCFLRKYFKVCISHIADADKFLNLSDVVLIRNFRRSIVVFARTGSERWFQGDLRRVPVHRSAFTF